MERSEDHLDRITGRLRGTKTERQVGRTIFENIFEHQGELRLNRET